MMELVDVTDSMPQPLLEPSQGMLEAPSGVILADLSLAEWTLGSLNLSAIAKLFTHAEADSTVFIAEIVFLDMNTSGTFYPWRTYRVDGVSQWETSMANELTVLLKKMLVDLT